MADRTTRKVRINPRFGDATLGGERRFQTRPMAERRVCHKSARRKKAKPRRKIVVTV
jgi:hypothetical protein